MFQNKTFRDATDYVRIEKTDNNWYQVFWRVNNNGEETYVGTYNVRLELHEGDQYDRRTCEEAGLKPLPLLEEYVYNNFVAVIDQESFWDSLYRTFVRYDIEYELLYNIEDTPMMVGDDVIHAAPMFPEELDKPQLLRLLQYYMMRGYNSDGQQSVSGIVLFGARTWEEHVNVILESLQDDYYPILDDEPLYD